MTISCTNILYHASPPHPVRAVHHDPIVHGWLIGKGPINPCWCCSGACRELGRGVKPRMPGRGVILVLQGWKGGLFLATFLFWGVRGRCLGDEMCPRES